MLDPKANERGQAWPSFTEIVEFFRSLTRSGRGGRRFKSCHSDQLSHISDNLRGLIWGTKPSDVCTLCLEGPAPTPTYCLCLIDAARSAHHSPEKYPWLTQLLALRPFKVVAVALANQT
jgi:hypothetical protein